LSLVHLRLEPPRTTSSTSTLGGDPLLLVAALHSEGDIFSCLQRRHRYQSSADLENPYLRRRVTGGNAQV